MLLALTFAYTKKDGVLMNTFLSLLPLSWEISTIPALAPQTQSNSPALAP
jgi:hypothetical protein